MVDLDVSDFETSPVPDDRGSPAAKRNSFSVTQEISPPQQVDHQGVKTSGIAVIDLPGEPDAFADDAEGVDTFRSDLAEHATVGCGNEVSTEPFVSAGDEVRVASGGIGEASTGLASLGSQQLWICEAGQARGQSNKR